MNRSSCRRRPKYIDIGEFLNWADNKMLKDKWSPDACVGYAKEEFIKEVKQLKSI